MNEIQTTELAKIYPYNLACAIFGVDAPSEPLPLSFSEAEQSVDEPEFEEPFDTPRDISLFDIYPLGVMSAVYELPEREREVISARFAECLTLEAAAKRFSCSRERIRQIEAKALQNLRHPIRTRQMLFSCLLGQAKRETEQERGRVEFVRNILASLKINAELASALDSIEILSNAKKYDKPLDNCGFYARVYNALRRTGCNTVGDIFARALVYECDVLTRPEHSAARKQLDEQGAVRCWLAAVDNVGVKSAFEAQAQLTALGLSLDEYRRVCAVRD